MNHGTFEKAIDGIRSIWGPLDDHLIDGCSRHLENLVRATATEPWLSALHLEAPASKELYRDPTHGFVLLAHMEYAGLYRPPHDHGRGWVIYAVQHGQIEMRTYARVVNADGSLRLVRRDSTLLRPGQVQVYLPGDIHDTRCMTGSALLFRFTERDLEKEDREEHRVSRFVERDGVWTFGTP